MEIQLRRGDELTLANYEEIFILANEWWREISNIPLNKEDVFNLIERLKDTSLFYFKDDKVIAYVGCLIIPHIFNRDYITCHVLSLVIDKAFKNTRLFYRILKDLDLLAKDNNAKNISITFFDNVKEKNLIRFSYIRKAKEYNKEL